MNPIYRNQPTSESKAKEFFLKNKLYILIGVGVLLATIAVVVVISLSGGSPKSGSPDQQLPATSSKSSSDESESGTPSKQSGKKKPAGQGSNADDADDADAAIYDPSAYAVHGELPTVPKGTSQPSSLGQQTADGASSTQTTSKPSQPTGDPSKPKPTGKPPKHQFKPSSSNTKQTFGRGFPPFPPPGAGGGIPIPPPPPGGGGGIPIPPPPPSFPPFPPTPYSLSDKNPILEMALHGTYIDFSEAVDNYPNWIMHALYLGLQKSPPSTNYPNVLTEYLLKLLEKVTPLCQLDFCSSIQNNLFDLLPAYSNVYNIWTKSLASPIAIKIAENIKTIQNICGISPIKDDLVQHFIIDERSLFGFKLSLINVFSVWFDYVAPEQPDQLDDFKRLKTIAGNIEITLFRSLIAFYDKFTADYFVTNCEGSDSYLINAYFHYKPDEIKNLSSVDHESLKSFINNSMIDIDSRKSFVTKLLVTELVPLLAYTLHSEELAKLIDSKCIYPPTLPIDFEFMDLISVAAKHKIANLWGPIKNTIADNGASFDVVQKKEIVYNFMLNFKSNDAEQLNCLDFLFTNNILSISNIELEWLYELPDSEDFILNTFVTDSTSAMEMLDRIAELRSNILFFYKPTLLTKILNTPYITDCSDLVSKDGFGDSDLEAIDLQNKYDNLNSMDVNQEEWNKLIPFSHTPNLKVIFDDKLKSTEIKDMNNPLALKYLIQEPSLIYKLNELNDDKVLRHALNLSPGFISNCTSDGLQEFGNFAVKQYINNPGGWSEFNSLWNQVPQLTPETIILLLDKKIVFNDFTKRIIECKPTPKDKKKIRKLLKANYPSDYIIVVSSNEFKDDSDLDDILTQDNFDYHPNQTIEFALSRFDKLNSTHHALIAKQNKIGEKVFNSQTVLNICNFVIQRNDKDTADALLHPHDIFVKWLISDISLVEFLAKAAVDPKYANIRPACLILFDAINKAKRNITSENVFQLCKVGFSSKDEDVFQSLCPLSPTFESFDENIYEFLLYVKEEFEKSKKGKGGKKSKRSKPSLLSPHLLTLLGAYSSNALIVDYAEYCTLGCSFGNDDVFSRLCPLSGNVKAEWFDNFDSVTFVSNNLPKIPSGHWLTILDFIKGGLTSDAIKSCIFPYFEFGVSRDIETISRLCLWTSEMKSSLHTDSNLVDKVAEMFTKYPKEPHVSAFLSSLVDWLENESDSFNSYFYSKLLIKFAKCNEETFEQIASVTLLKKFKSHEIVSFIFSNLNDLDTFPHTAIVLNELLKWNESTEKSNLQLLCSESCNTESFVQLITTNRDFLIKCLLIESFQKWIKDTVIPDGTFLGRADILDAIEHVQLANDINLHISFCLFAMENSLTEPKLCPTRADLNVNTKFVAEVLSKYPDDEFFSNALSFIFNKLKSTKFNNKTLFEICDVAFTAPLPKMHFGNIRDSALSKVCPIQPQWFTEDEEEVFNFIKPKLNLYGESDYFTQICDATFKEIANGNLKKNYLLLLKEIFALDQDIIYPGLPVSPALYDIYSEISIENELKSRIGRLNQFSTNPGFCEFYVSLTKDTKYVENCKIGLKQGIDAFKAMCPLIPKKIDRNFINWYCQEVIAMKDNSYSVELTKHLYNWFVELLTTKYAEFVKVQEFFSDFFFTIALKSSSLFKDTFSNLNILFLKNDYFVETYFITRDHLQDEKFEFTDNSKFFFELEERLLERVTAPTVDLEVFIEFLKGAFAIVWKSNYVFNKLLEDDENLRRAFGDANFKDWVIKYELSTHMQNSIINWARYEGLMP